MNLFFAAGHQGQRIVSDDGAEWKNLQLGKEGETYRAAAAGNGVHVAVGNFGGANIIAATKDGATWDVSNREGQYKNFIRGLAFGNGGFLPIGGAAGSARSSSPVLCPSSGGAKLG